MKLRRQPAIKLLLARKRKEIALRMPLQVRKRRALSRALSSGVPSGDVRETMGIFSPGTQFEISRWPTL